MLKDLDLFELAIQDEELEKWSNGGLRVSKKIRERFG